MEILYVDACIRDSSRTRELAKVLLSRLSGRFTELFLREEPLFPMTEKELNEREAKNTDGDTAVLAYAKQFAKADTVVLAAPYWDLSFPAQLKLYLEKICIGGVTFRYGENGKIESLCRASHLYYVTTAGGYIGENNFGFDYVKALAKNFFAIPDVRFFSAQGLDIFGNDEKKILEEAKDKIKSFDFSNESF